MDVVLGVAVTGPVARLALVEPGARGADVIDQSVVDLEDNPVGKLAETVVGTNRLLAGENHRLVGTRLCWADGPRAAQLEQALQDSGVPNVAVLSESQAVTALMRAAGRPGAALVMDDATGTLTAFGSTDGNPDAPPTMLAQQPFAAGASGALGAEATAALDTMMAQLRARPDAPGEVYLVGTSAHLGQAADQFRDGSTMRVQVAEDPTFALARGAAIAAAPLTGDATAMAPMLTGDATAMAPMLTGDETTMVPTSEFAGADAEEPQLAYSMADQPEFDDYGDEYFDDYGDLDEAFDEEGAPARLSRRSLLIGNAVIAFAVVGLASLATAIAIAVRPTAAQQPVVGVQNGTPGKFMPVLPTQQQAPLPPPPVDQPNAGFQGGTVPAPATGGSIPQQVAPGAPAPVPAGPGTPGFVPNPNPAVPLPIPIPVPIPFPGWHPNYPPYIPPYTPPTNPPMTTYSPPTTTYTPPTTTQEPPTTTYTPPSTTHEPPTTTYSPPTTTYSPPSTTHEAPSTTHEPPTATYSPPQTHTQQTVPPTHSQQPVVPQEPHSGGDITGSETTP